MAALALAGCSAIKGYSYTPAQIRSLPNFELVKCSQAVDGRAAILMAMAEVPPSGESYEQGTINACAAEVNARMASGKMTQDQYAAARYATQSHTVNVNHSW